MQGRADRATQSDVRKAVILSDRKEQASLDLHHDERILVMVWTTGHSAPALSTCVPPHVKPRTVPSLVHRR